MLVVQENPLVYPCKKTGTPNRARGHKLTPGTVLTGAPVPVAGPDGTGPTGVQDPCYSLMPDVVLAERLRPLPSWQTPALWQRHTALVCLTHAPGMPVPESNTGGSALGGRNPK